MWKEMTEADKLPYEQMVEKDRLRYANQTEEMNKNGFFVMQDGTKSCDAKPKVKLGKRSAPDVIDGG